MNLKKLETVLKNMTRIMIWWFYYSKWIKRNIRWLF